MTYLSQLHPMEQESSGRKSANRALECPPVALQTGHAARISNTPPKGREGPPQASAVAVAGRTWPSACDRCIPVVRIVSADFFVTVTETSHERACVHHPDQNTQTPKTLSEESTTKW